MNSEVLAGSRQGAARAPKRLFRNPLRTALLGRLAKIEWGTLEVQEPGQSPVVFGSRDDTQPRAVLRVLDPNAWTYVTLGADIGAGQAYALDYWDSDDLCALLRIILRNPSILEDVETRWSHLARPVYRLMHRLRDNSRSGSRGNIRAHYDLGNDFFSSFLDERLLYSSAIFPHAGASLEDAQVEKVDRICRNLGLQPGQRILEIGSGWGGFALHAAKRYGVHVHTITLSEEQHRYTQQRVDAAGLASQVDVQLTDYRDVDGHEVYDHVVSIEMIEAVGHRHMGTYLATVDRLLKPGGTAMIQGITFPDRGFARYLQMSDFIRHFIFPGGSLVSLQQILEAAAGSTRLEMVHLEEIGLHYAATLREWFRRFQMARGELPQRYQDREFQRLWAFYLQSCEACFLERRTGTVQIGLRKAECA